MVGKAVELVPCSPAAAAGPLLGCADLRLSFGSTTALDGVSLELAAGEVVAVIGPSGSGKSSLLHCLSGITTPTGGGVSYRGRRLGDLTDAERTRLRLREFGFVFQFGQLVPELTAVENITLPLRWSGLPAREATARAHQALLDLDVPELRGRRPGEMSGGQQQRVAVARALAAEPSVIFADEPTGALDSLNGERVVKALLSQVRRRGCTLVLVTHDHQVAAYAEREIVLRDGRVVADSAAGS
jgi:putative ABC transport system ATP-binding protein